MNKLQFSHVGHVIKEIDIDDFENHYSVKLPDEYKQFLLVTNGGIPNMVYFVKDDSDLVVNFFLSLGSEKYSLEEYFEDYKIRENILPIDLLPIGEDAFGNIICISNNSERYGSIHLWYHEDARIKYLSDTLNELLNNLQNDI